jgi:hypothetical protein
MLLVSTKNQDLRERFHKGQAGYFLTRVNARVSSLAFRKQPLDNKKWATGPPHATPLRGTTMR